MLQKKTVHEYVIGIGSNLDNAMENVETAFGFLKRKFDAVVFSDIIPTRAVGMQVDCVFLNAVAKIKTSMTPTQLKLFLKETERQMERIPHSEEVVIDLDIILADGRVVHEDYEKRGFIRELIQKVE
jgi:2-amino-4-hydroxy-6-hydroxymethyldihydropteridine diphosphokinase